MCGGYVAPMQGRMAQGAIYTVSALEVRTYRVHIADPSVRQSLLHCMRCVIFFIFFLIGSGKFLTA
jgi:hypothetical protein